MQTNERRYAERMRALGCVVVIPTYNNAGTVLQVVGDVKRYADDIIVVNDGSTDATAQLLARTEGIEVIGYAKNRGKGHALKKGLKRACERGFRYALTIDADGQHFADDIPVFLERAEQSPDCLLIGARNLTADNMPSKNTFANKFSNFWFAVETGRKLSDTQSGFRLYPLTRLRNMRLIGWRYEFEVEIIVRAAWRGIPVENVPVRVYYAPEGERVSHFRPLRDFTRISILNTCLVTAALLFYYPWRFLRMLTLRNIREFFRRYITASKESNLRLAAAMGWGVFCGIIPLWGYQMIFAGVSAHLMRLNKVVTIVFSNVSIPPMIPFILYGSYVTGGLMLGLPASLGIGDMSFETITRSLMQYVAGSFAFAALCGALTTGIGWLLLTLFKRDPDYE